MTEIDDDEEDIGAENKKEDVNLGEISSLLKVCAEKSIEDFIEDDLTVESIQNNKTNSILIDDVLEEDHETEGTCFTYKDSRRLSDSSSGSIGKFTEFAQTTDDNSFLSEPRNAMIRQKSDLSENLIISSTPEAERYFERKNDSLNERVEKGELDIEVMPEMIIKDDNDGVPESLLQVLDEGP